jgi:hypothetical protein
MIPVGEVRIVPVGALCNCDYGMALFLGVVIGIGIAAVIYTLNDIRKSLKGTDILLEDLDG